MRPTALAALLALPLLAGCLAAPRPPQVPAAGALAFAPPVDVPCRTLCYEPSIAADSRGRLLVSPGLGDGALLFRSDDGGRSFRPTPGPPLLGNLTPVREDYLVQSGADGAVWFSAMVGMPLATPVSPAQQYYGLQVARSTDGGLTWGPNVLVQPGDRVDRQWVAVGAGRVYLTWQTFGEGVGVARSDDGGATFRKVAHLRDGASVTGAPCVLPSGRVVFPVVGADGLRVRLSDDLGATWRSAPAVGFGAYFPALACGEASLRLAWWTRAAIHVATSTDAGETWTLDQEWEGRLLAPSVSPALVADAGGATVASFRRDADGMALQVLRRDAAGFHAGVATAGLQPYMNSTRANTDFASLAMLPDGRVATVWSPSRDAVQVAVEQR